MLTNQLYYDFSREVEKLRNNMFSTNSNFNRDTQVLTKQLIQLHDLMDMRNREIERRLLSLQKIVELISSNRTY